MNHGVYHLQLSELKCNVKREHLQRTEELKHLVLRVRGSPITDRIGVGSTGGQGIALHVLPIPINEIPSDKTARRVMLSRKMR